MQILSHSSPLTSAIPASPPLAPQGVSPTSVASPALVRDGLQIDYPRAGKNAVALIGGAGAGLLTAGAGSALVGLALEQGISSDMFLAAAVGAVTLGVPAGAAGALTSAVLTDDPKTGAILGAVSGAATGAALTAKANFGGRMMLLAGALGAAAGAVGGWTAAHLRQ